METVQFPEKLTILFFFFFNVFFSVFSFYMWIGSSADDTWL